MKRANGAGSVVKLKMRDASGKQVETTNYYIFYRVNGRQVRESSESESKMVAEALLRKRQSEALAGIRPAQDVKHLTFDDISKAYLDQCHTDGVVFFQKTDGSEYLRGVPNLAVFFRGMKITSITTDTLRSYIAARRDKKAADPTIRRELITLRAMFNQARKENKLRVSDVPHFPMPPDSKPRKGFVNPDVFAKLLAALPKHLRPLVLFLYRTGCRVGAAQRIKWEMVNEDCSEVELPGEITKSGEPLTLPLVGEGLDEVSQCLRMMFRNDGPVFDARNLRKEWDAACTQLGLGVREAKMRDQKDKKTGKVARVKYWTYGGLTLHDLRRSAVRNLRRAGVSEDVSMAISGHKTRSIFARYNITDTADIREALIKVGQYAKQHTEAGQSVSKLATDTNLIQTKIYRVGKKKLSA